MVDESRTTRRAFVGGLTAAVTVPIDVEASPAALKASFLRWLGEAKTALKVPIIVTELLADRIRFGFGGYTPVLRGWIGHREGYRGAEMLIDAEFQGIWDGLRWPDSVCPVRRSGGWVCATCEGEGHPVLFESAEAIWRDHLFDDLLEWVNESLTPATHIAFYDDRAQWVNLLQEADANATYILPVKSLTDE
jgi:hypothetical protein